MSGYQGVPGGPRDPRSDGSYCLAVCLCGGCPQYAAQAAAVKVLREMEWAARDRRVGERAARQQRKMRGAA